jgi:hypothetical protein
MYSNTTTQPLNIMTRSILLPSKIPIRATLPNSTFITSDYGTFEIYKNLVVLVDFEDFYYKPRTHLRKTHNLVPVEPRQQGIYYATVNKVTGTNSVYVTCSYSEVCKHSRGTSVEIPENQIASRILGISIARLGRKIPIKKIARDQVKKHIANKKQLTKIYENRHRDTHGKTEALIYVQNKIGSIVGPIEADLSKRLKVVESMAGFLEYIKRLDSVKADKQKVKDITKWKKDLKSMRRAITIGKYEKLVDIIRKKYGVQAERHVSSLDAARSYVKVNARNIAKTIVQTMFKPFLAIAPLKVTLMSIAKFIQSPSVKKKITFMSQTLFWVSSITGVFVKIVEYLSEDQI